MMNEAKRLCQLATELFITYTMHHFPDMDPRCNMARSKLLRPLIYGSDGAKVYHQQLLRLALSGLDEVVNVSTLMVTFTSGNNEDLDNASEKKNNALAKMAFQLLKDRYPKEGGKVEGLCVAHGKMALQRTLEMMSSVMDTELASHLKGRLPILQEKVSLCFVSLFHGWSYLTFTVYLLGVDVQGRFHISP